MGGWEGGREGGRETGTCSLGHKSAGIAYELILPQKILSMASCCKRLIAVVSRKVD